MARTQPYVVVIGGFTTTMKLTPETAARYPGARPLGIRTMQIPEPAPAADAALKHLGGGWYGLPDGQRIRGAAAAQAALEGSS